MAGDMYTLLFTDLVQSTEVLDQLGDAATESLRRAHARLLQSHVETHGGRQIKNTGDGVMAAFTAASDAVRCAIAVQQAVDLHNRTSGLRPLDVRVGLHLGEVEDDGGDYFGTAVVVASRLCDNAGAGQIFVSDVVRSVAAARGDFMFDSLGPLALKGFDNPVSASLLLWDPMPAADVAPSGEAFVGRGPELGTLREAWAASKAGSRQLVLLSGEPGIGKTRLALRLGEEVAADGGVVLLGRCDEQAPLPYQPFIEALAAHSGEDLIAAATPVAGPIVGAADAERYRFYASVSRALQELAEAGPVLLVLDDLHWADEGTLLLLRYLLRRTQAMRLLVLGTYRDTDLSRSYPLASSLGEIAREGAQRMDLRGLSAADVAALLGTDVPETTARAVYAETDGNPFFVQEVGRHLAEDGDAGSAAIPQGVRDVIGRRVTRLSDDSAALLQVAAVIGRDFDIAVLSVVAGLSDDDVLRSLEEASRARLVEEVPGVLDRYRFAHALVRDSLLHEIGTSRRVRISDKTVSVLEALYAASLNAHLPALAHHSFEAAAAGDTTRAARYALEAARYSVRRFGIEEATRLCTQGLQALDMGPGDERLRCELLVERSAAYGWIDTRKGSPDAEKARVIARGLGEARLFARAAVAGYLPGLVYVPEQEAVLTEALAALPPKEIDLRATLLGMLTMATLFGPDRSHSAEYSRRAMELVDDVVDETLASQALYFASFGPMVMRGEVELGDRILALAERSGQRQLEIPGRTARLSALICRNDFAAARAEVVGLAALESHVPGGFLSYALLALGALFALVEGRHEEGRRLSRESRGVAAQESSEAMGEMTPAIQAFTRLREQGRSADLIPTTQAATGMQPGVGWTAALAALLADVGELDEARVVLEPLVADDMRQLRSMSWGVDRYSCALAIEACARIGDRELLAGLYEVLHPDADLGISLVFGPIPLQWLGSSHLYLGIAALGLGRSETAVEHLQEALAIHDKVGARPLAARVRHFLAVALSQLGRADHAAQLRTEAVATAKQLGLVALEREISDLSFGT